MLSAFSQAWASWKTAPGVAVLAVVAFAVGIGSATAIFTVINGVLLRPLPYADGDRFVSLYGVNTTNPGPMMMMSVPELQDYEQQTTSFDAFGWFRAGRFHLTAPGEPQWVPGAAVTPALARQLGPPRLGQWFGGDYYDFVELGDGRIGIALADVSGKGVAAALIMSVVQASLRIISSEGDVPPPRLVARMNEFVYRSTPGNKYATFFYAQLDTQRRQLRYVNAGHNAPFLLRAGRRSTSDCTSFEIEPLSVGGTVVGMFPEMEYEEATVELCPGDVLLAFTDGVPEAHNPENEEFGEERLQQLLRHTAHLPANEISARLSDGMKDWIRDAEQYDDLTFIVMKVR